MPNNTLPLNKYGNRRGMSLGSRANLSKPGETHNHRGGPQISILDLLRQELKKVPLKGLDGADNNEHLNNAQLIVSLYMEDIRNGNTALLRDLLDRIHGKPIQAISGPGGGPLEIRQETKVISQEAIQPALSALIECGVVSVGKN